MRNGQDAVARQVQWFETRYTLAYLGGERLPQTASIVKRATETGYQVVVATEHFGEFTWRMPLPKVPEEYVTLNDLDTATNGQLKRILPGLRSAFGTLQAEFGDVANSSLDVLDQEQRRKAREDFLTGRLRILHTTYGPGSGTLPLCDTDYADLFIKGGGKPRVAVFLAPPLSGSTGRAFDEAGAGTKGQSRGHSGGLRHKQRHKCQQGDEGDTASY